MSSLTYLLRSFNTMICKTCFTWTGECVEHEECDLRATLVCRRCCCAGHSTSECDYDNMCNPTCLEDLIPLDIKERYGIISNTDYNSTVDNKRKTHPIRNLDIINKDKWIREFMKNQNIHTARKCEDNIAKILEWAAKCGLSVRFLNEET